MKTISTKARLNRFISISVLSKRLSYVSTHEVFNQSPPFVNINLLLSDPALVDSLRGNLSQLKDDKLNSFDWNHLQKFAVQSGTAEMMKRSEDAEKNRPVLKQFDNYGRRIDIVEYHEAYHLLMKHALTNGAAAYGFKNPIPGSQLMRASLIYFENQVEAGHCCPVVMTAAAIPVLKRNSKYSPWIESFLNSILAQNYDPANRPIENKSGVTIGMSMTEKQGGSDVRANTTLATPISEGSTGPGQAYTLVGHKWFTSAPMCDAFLTLAKTSPNDTSVSCFIVPRWCPDGSRNAGFQVMRLKDKLADRANASSEVEYRNAWGMMLGEEGKGVKTIIEMVQATRLDCTLGSAGAARRALQVVLNHVTTRNAFGRKLSEQPLMQSVLADLCVESEAHTMMAIRMAAAYDAYYNGDASILNCENVSDAREIFRIGVTASKYFVTKRLPHFTYECMESMGGNGFVEDFPMAKLFRHSPLNAIWEGSGNVIALDMLRGIKSLPFLFKEIRLSYGMDSQLDNYIKAVEKSAYAIAGDPLSLDSQRAARNLMDRISIALQASILLRFGNEDIKKSYLARFIHKDNSQSAGINYGGAVVIAESAAKRIIERNLPVFRNE